MTVAQDDLKVIDTDPDDGNIMYQQDSKLWFKMEEISSKATSERDPELLKELLIKAKALQDKMHKGVCYTSKFFEGEIAYHQNSGDLIKGIEILIEEASKPDDGSFNAQDFMTRFSPKFTSLFFRWQDEKEYEDWADYEKHMPQILAVYSDKLTFHDCSHTPFAVVFQTQDGDIYKLRTNSRQATLQEMEFETPK